MLPSRLVGHSCGVYTVGVHDVPPGFYQSAEWRELRLRALRRDGWMCLWCGRSVRGKGQSRVDHVRTVREAPHLALSLDNLRTLCPSCDNKRHSEKGKHHEPVNAQGYPQDWQ